MRVSFEHVADQPLTYFARFHQDAEGSYAKRSAYNSTCLVSVHEDRPTELRGLDADKFTPVLWRALRDALERHGIESVRFERADGRVFEVTIARNSTRRVDA